MAYNAVLDQDDVDFLTEYVIDEYIPNIRVWEGPDLEHKESVEELMRKLAAQIKAAPSPEEVTFGPLQRDFTIGFLQELIQVTRKQPAMVAKLSRLVVKVRAHTLMN